MQHFFTRKGKASTKEIRKIQAVIADFYASRGRTRSAQLVARKIKPTLLARSFLKTPPAPQRTLHVMDVCTIKPWTSAPKPCCPVAIVMERQCLTSEHPEIRDASCLLKSRSLCLQFVFFTCGREAVSKKDRVQRPDRGCRK